MPAGDADLETYDDGPAAEGTPYPTLGVAGSSDFRVRRAFDGQVVNPIRTPGVTFAAYCNLHGVVDSCGSDC